MSSELAVHIRGLGKAYHIYHRPMDRLKQMLWRGRRRFYDEYWALHDINLDVARGETIGVIGRNGSGKSTLLQILCGTLQPSCGESRTFGRVAALLELGAGFNPEFTGSENVYLAASILGLSRAEIESRYQDIIDFASIGDFIKQPVKIYSSGMYARLAFAVAAHVNAEILIIDEILAVGDASFTQKCMRYIREFRKNGTLFFVSHDMAAVVNLCDRTLWLENGCVRRLGETKQVCHEYMASVQAEKDNPASFKIGGARRAPTAQEQDLPPDPRHELLLNSNLRNTIQIFDFNPDAPWFGKRGASITGVRLTDLNGAKLASLSGGEEVRVEICARAETNLRDPIVGFYVKDRLGQQLFGDNTYLSYLDRPVSVEAGRELVAKFRFRMPYLPSGEYSMCPAIALGDQDDHLHQHWIDDALFFKVVSSHVARGLVGVPMTEIELQVQELQESVNAAG
jgi:lipopolysaccharide transport system ATP-binding protein